MAESTKGYLGNSFTVNGVPVTEYVDTCLNIQKRRARFKFKTQPSEDNTNISYVLTRDTNPSSNLVISDRSISLIQNRLKTVNDPITFIGSSLNIQTERLLITSIFTTEVSTQIATPLFYYHKFINFNPDNSDWSYKTLLSAEFTDYLFNTISVSEYSTDEDTGKFYNNLENSYDGTEGSFVAYYVKYTVSNTSSGSTVIEVHHELLNNKPVFHPATFDDIGLEGTLDPSSFGYLVDRAPGGETFSVKLPASNTYAYKELSTSRVNVLPPTALTTRDPWYLRIQNGKFITSLIDGSGSYTPFLYGVPEFTSQTFSPYPPYKGLPLQRAVWLYDNLIKTPKNIAYDPPIGMYVEVQVRNSDNTLRAIYTDDVAKIGEYYNDTVAYEDKILSIDEMGGFVEVDDTLKDNDIIYVSYFTEETELELTSLDLNPTSSRNSLRERISIYVNPESVYTGELTDSIHYLRINQLGEVVYAEQATSDSLDHGTIQIKADFSSDGRPKSTMYYDDAGSGWSFIDKYTVESTLVQSGVLPTTEPNLTYFSNNPRFLVLADVYVGENISPQGITDLDVRKRGGGLKDRNRTEAFEQQPEATFFWDENSRFPYPGMGSFLVEVPRSVLQDYGGDFTLSQIQDIVYRHAEFGSYAIVREYGIDPVVSGVLPASGSFLLSWPSYGEGTEYNVYISPEEDRSFERINSSAIIDGGTSNYYNVIDLDIAKTYYTYVTAVDSNGYEHPGPTTYTQTLATDI